MDKGYVYTLALSDGCYYVGYSAVDNVQTRIASHFLGAGSLWTQKHKPLAIVSVQPGDTLLETLVTISLMCRHGFERVRGGSYCALEMTKAPACIQKALHYASYKTKPEEPADTTEAQATSDA